MDDSIGQSLNHNSLSLSTPFHRLDTWLPTEHFSPLPISLPPSLPT